VFDEPTGMEDYAIFRRGGWRTATELGEAAARSAAEVEQMPERVRWIRSYVVAEQDGSIGTICIFQASSPEAVRDHAQRSALPVDEIVAVVDTFVVRPDPFPAAI
jgi:hypothetical protein